MITAELWTLAQCNDAGNVSAHDKHAHMSNCSHSCLLAANAYLYSSKATVIHSLCLDSWCSKCLPVAFIYALSGLDSVTVWWQSQWQIDPFFTCASSQLINILNLLFIHTFLHHFPYIVRKHFKQAHCSIFLWPPYVIGGPLYFCPVVSFFYLLLLFFPRLISAAVDWMSAILLHMAWP